MSYVDERGVTQWGSPRRNDQDALEGGSPGSSPLASSRIGSAAWSGQTIVVTGTQPFKLAGADPRRRGLLVANYGSNVAFAETCAVFVGPTQAIKGAGPDGVGTGYRIDPPIDSTGTRFPGIFAHWLPTSDEVWVIGQIAASSIIVTVAAFYDA